jgi:hypothetical protein
LFKISNFILGGEANVTDMYMSLKGEKGSERVIYRERRSDKERDREDQIRLY